MSIHPAHEHAQIWQEAQRWQPRTRGAGGDLTGPDGLLKHLTKTVIESALEEELVDHLGYDKHDPAGRNGANSRNGYRSKTVVTDNCGEVQIAVPRDRDGSFEPVIVAKRQRRLTDLETLVISLYAKGLTTGEISAHLFEVYGANVSRDTVSRKRRCPWEELIGRGADGDRGEESRPVGGRRRT